MHGHFNESYRAVLSYDTVHSAVGACNFQQVSILWIKPWCVNIQMKAI